ncbi:hypothetical protein AW27_023435 [Streptomyces sp. PCS3-D2]|uniref:hypothetical protein n=1 Tax=Streptomyces sp. PCS3-D2 TaxID=1460244 RepID=UPI0012FE9A94|nr:hypothetical protein [Streptomyces sp. PCS3-D2]WKV74197.1 hypothetical protein AW27_023435 [Streptomyces sp. PCS3-D2]
MIDVQRVIALSQQPRQGSTTGTPVDPSRALMLLSDLGNTSEPLARPIAWSAAACRSAAAAMQSAGSPADLCRTCPIRHDCAGALLAGAPAEVRAWRDRVEAGGLLAA